MNRFSTGGIKKPSRTKTITYNSKNVMPGNAERVYANKPIKQRKVIDTPRRTKIVDYGPINYYGKQKKTKTIIRK